MTVVASAAEPERGRFMARRTATFAVIGLTTLLLSVANAPVQASEATRVLTAFDDAVGIPYSFRLGPSFEQRYESGRISRESECTDPDSGICPAFQSELDYRRITNLMNMDLGIGLYRDLEFHMRLPIVISDQRRLQFADGVTRNNSSIDPANPGQFRGSDPDTADYYRFNYRFFNVGAENRGPSRAGVGDMTFGFAWKAFNQEKSPHLADLVLRFDYTAPTGRTARADNTGVGRGVHELGFGIRAGRDFDHFSPFMGVEFNLPLPASDTLFQDLGGNRQRFRGPGMSGSILLGTEIILYEEEKQQRYTFNLQSRITYISEGRDYGPLFEALSRSGCNGVRLSEVGTYENRYDGSIFPRNRAAAQAAERPECGWIVQQPSNEGAGGRYFHDGITLIDAHQSIAFGTGFNLQFSPHVQLRLFADFETRSSHFLTGERTGRSTSEDGRVDLDPAAGERNPYYNPTLDSVGNRFYLERIFNWSWGTQMNFYF